MMMPAAAPSSLSLVGPRERLALWDPFGAVQCELGITSRHVCTLLQQPPGLSLSLTHSPPCPPVAYYVLLLLLLDVASDQSNPLRQSNSQQALGQREGRARPGRRSFWSRLLVFPVGFSRLWGRRRMNERPHLSGHNLFLGVPTPLLPPAPGPLAEFH